MIKLFRNIRRKYLAKSRFGKYLLYAIGEIFLVVIGILIALNINNWNENRKEGQELNDYLIKISENIAEDLEVVESHLKKRQRIQTNSRKNMLHIFNEQYDSLSVSQNVEIFVDFNFVPRRNGFQALTNSGYINKLKRSRLDSLLYRYYFTVDEIHREELSFNGYMESMEISVGETISIIPVAKQYFGQPVDDKEVLKNNTDYFQNVALQAAIARACGQTIIIEKYKNLISTGVLLNNAIVKRINSTNE
tara:strand:- start:736 stop:1482 length:747 start_codon:yes stop_codon:yes gene_type:complete